MGNLKQDIKKNFSQESLSPEQVEMLDKLQRDFSDRSFKRKTWYMAMCLGVVIFAISISVSRFSNFMFLPSKIAKEIAKNHTKDVELQIKTKSLQDVQQSLDKLGFELAYSDKFSNLELIGGRYCEIQGERAAQLRYIDRETDLHYTVYQSKIPKNVKRSQIMKFKQDVDGTHVKVWIEDETLFGLAY